MCDKTEWIEELGSNLETMMTYKPYDETENLDFSEPMGEMTILAPTRILEQMIDMVFE